MENVTATSTTAATPIALLTNTATLTPAPQPTLTATPTPTASLSPTPIPTITPTATLIPLSSHTWQSGPVVARLDYGGCIDVCMGEVFSPLPKLILYTDGRLIINQYDRIDQYQLSTSEICAFLHTVDQIGFWHYDDTQYLQQQAAFPGFFNPFLMTVNGWQSNTIEAGNLYRFIEGGGLEGRIKIAPELMSAYQLFERFRRYQPGQRATYMPQQVALEISRLAETAGYLDATTDKGEWPLPTITLNELWLQTDEMAQLVVTGTVAAEIYALFDYQFFPGWNIYQEGDHRYTVALRPLLPYESSGGDNTIHFPLIPSPDISVSTTELTCTPADGVFRDLLP